MFCVKVSSSSPYYRGLVSLAQGFNAMSISVIYSLITPKIQYGSGSNIYCKPRTHTQTHTHLGLVYMRPRQTHRYTSELNSLSRGYYGTSNVDDLHRRASVIRRRWPGADAGRRTPASSCLPGDGKHKTLSNGRWPKVRNRSVRKGFFDWLTCFRTSPPISLLRAMYWATGPLRMSS